MKYLTILLMLICTTVTAGPAVDRARAAMQAFRPGITDAVGLELLNAWAVTVEPRTKAVITCEEELCVTIQELVPWNKEEMAQLWLDKHYDWNNRRLIQYRKMNKRLELAIDQAALDNQIEAVSEL